MPITKTTGSPNENLVVVDLSDGESIRHTVTLVQGGKADFALTSRGVPLLRSTMPPSQPNTWTETWSPETLDSPIYQILKMAFLRADVYGWKIEHLDGDGQSTVVRDVQYTGTNKGTRAVTVLVVP